MKVRQLKIMGILNVTPDSFSDGGKYFDLDQAVARAEEMVREGAEIIDVGGESSGPGSVDVSLEEELRRVVGVVQELGIRKLGVRVSVDTWKAEVARQAIEAGATIVNDVTALRGDDQMAAVIAESGVKVVLMYSKDDSARTTAENVEYDDVVATIKSFLVKRIAYAEAKGIEREQMIIDPGMGAFVSGKAEYSWEILERLREFEELGCPILIGASRKSFLGGDVEDRLEPSLKAAKLATDNGASILRVHDIAETRKLGFRS